MQPKRIISSIVLAGAALVAGAGVASAAAMAPEPGAISKGPLVRSFSPLKCVPLPSSGPIEGLNGPLHVLDRDGRAPTLICGTEPDPAKWWSGVGHHR